MSSRLTEQQSRAVTHQPDSVVLASGAGCGKTSVLTARYLWYLTERGADIDRLVAITFTDKAAREMRKRIRAEVESRAKAAKGAERERWRAQLRALETAEISTIHTFCGNLLRRHALAANLDPGFQILDAAVADGFLATSIRDGLTRLLTDAGPAGEALHNLIRHYGWGKIRREIPELVRGGGDWRPHLSLSNDELAKRWSKEADASKRLALAFYRRRLGLDAKLDQLRRLNLPGPKITGNLATLFDCWQTLDTAHDLAALLNTMLTVSRVQGAETKKSWADPDEFDFCRDTLAVIRDDFCKKLFDIAADAPELGEAAAVGLDFLRVADACRVEYGRAKERQGGLDFDDLLLRARDLLRDRPDICTSSGSRIQYLLVDELQDTDAVQMDIVRKLCGDVGAGKLFAVGDAKQSIYRFRGAEVELFERLREDVPVRHSLSSNFRSRQELLDFANALFQDDLPSYEPLTAGLQAPKAEHCVEFLWGTQEGRHTDEARKREADRIAKRVAEMVGKERLVIDRKSGTPELRPVKRGDVVLLFRSMSNVMYYESALHAYGLDYYLVGGRAFYAQQEVYDLANLLRALENPGDAVALVGVLRSPFGCLSDDALVILATHKEGYCSAIQDTTLRAELPPNDRRAAERLAAWLPKWRKAKDQLTITRLLSLVLADTGYDAALRFEFLGDRKVANLWKLMEEARTFDRAGQRVADFIAHLDRVIDAQPREEQAATQPEKSDVVRLMSIHQAKGLEFPVVFLPDLNAVTGGFHSPICRFDRRFGPVVLPPKEDGENLFTDYPLTLWKARERFDEWNEDLRIAYVACTRAADYLVLSGSLPQPFNAQSTAMQLLSERFDIQSGACKLPNAKVTVRVLQPGDEPPPRRDATPERQRPVDGDKAGPLAAPAAKTPIDDPPRWHWLFRQTFAQWDVSKPDGWRSIMKILGATAEDRRRFEQFVDSPAFRAFSVSAERHAGVVVALLDHQNEPRDHTIDLLWSESGVWSAMSFDSVEVDQVAAQLSARLGPVRFVSL